MAEGVARAYLWTGDDRFRRVLTEALHISAGGSPYGKSFSMYYRMAPRVLADMDAAGTWTGCVFAHARGKVAGRGTRTVIDEKGKKTITKIGDPAKLLKHVKLNDWNEYRIIAKGPKLTLMINGVLMCEAVDHEKGKAALDGIIALQVHPGPPMKVQFKDILLKKLD